MMEFKTYIKTVEAFQWFPGKDLPWPMEMMEANQYHKNPIYYVDVGRNGEFGASIVPGDYIVKDGRFYTIVAEKRFNEVYVRKDSNDKPCTGLEWVYFP